MQLAESQTASRLWKLFKDAYNFKPGQQRISRLYLTRLIPIYRIPSSFLQVFESSVAYFPPLHNAVQRLLVITTHL